LASRNATFEMVVDTEMLLHQQVARGGVIIAAR
jgi:hypothetical protein